MRLRSGGSYPLCECRGTSESCSEEFAQKQPPSKSEFTVNAGSASGEVYILGRCSGASCPTIRYHGPSVTFNTPSTHGQVSRVFDPAVEIVLAHACGRDAEKIPADIWKRYAVAKPEEKQFVTSDYAEMCLMQTRTNGDNTHREVK